MCSGLCMHSWISAWGISWVHLARIQVTLHELWAGAFITPLLLLASSPHHQENHPYCCLPVWQISKISHPGWKSAAVIRESSLTLRVCSRWALCACNVLWHWLPVFLRKELISSGQQQGEMTTHHSGNRLHLRVGKQSFVFLPSSPVLQYVLHRGSRVQVLVIWSNAHEFSMRLKRLRVFLDFFKITHSTEKW